jgi:MoaA/NifB/PqqE/SkfB family radical SAM enzyme
MRTFHPNRLYVVLWITFQCNYKCSYCPVVTKFDYGKIFTRKDEKTPDQWITALEKLPRARIYISGGEPFIYKGLPDLINNQSKHVVTGVVTNASAPAKVYERVKKKIQLNLSFHPEFTSQDEFLRKIQELKELTQFSLVVNIVATPDNLPIIAAMNARLVDQNVTLHVDPLVDPDMQFQYSDEELRTLMTVLTRGRKNSLDRLNYRSYKQKKCSAGRNYINIMPNGDVFRCAGGFEYMLSPLRKSILENGPSAPYDATLFSMGNIFDENFSLDTNDIICGLPCPAACDRDMARIKFIS